MSDDGYCYIRHRLAQNKKTEYWMCEQRGKCHGRGITKNNRHEFQRSQEHNHLPNKLMLEMRQIQNQIKETAAKANYADTASILQASLITASDAVKARLPRINSLKRNIQRNKARVSQMRNVINIPTKHQSTNNTDPNYAAVGDSTIRRNSTDL